MRVPNIVNAPKQLAAALMLAAAASASAQVAIAPESTKWGETITITADPSVWKNETQRFYKSDRLYALLHAYHQGLWSPRDALAIPMTWDGSRFVGRVALPEGCEAGSVSLATPEKLFETAHSDFMCRRPDGSLPPGAVIAGLFNGSRDKSNWKSDIAQDLADLRKVNGHGWEYYYAWPFAWREEKTPVDERLRQVEKVELEEGKNAGPALLGSIVFGYFRAGQPRRHSTGWTNCALGFRIRRTQSPSACASLQQTWSTTLSSRASSTRCWRVWRRRRRKTEACVGYLRGWRPRRPTYHSPLCARSPNIG